MPSLPDVAHAGWMCTFLHNNCRKFQLLSGHPVQYRKVRWYTVKKGLAVFQSLGGISLTVPTSPWPGIFKLFPTRENLVSDIPPGTGKPLTLFYMQCTASPSRTKSHLPGHSSRASQAGRRVEPTLYPSASLVPPQEKGILSWARICKRLWSPGVDSEESMPLAYVAWRAGTTYRVVVPVRQLGINFWAP